MYIEVMNLQEGATNAVLTAYLQDSAIDSRFPIVRPAVIICPGGAFIGITEKEADPIAMRFLAAGYHVFILKYSIGVGMATFPAPFIDAAKSIMMIRENAKKWCTDPDKISFCGFSTGGYVAAFLAVSWQEAYLSKALNAPSELFKPNALILGYPLLELIPFVKKNLKESSTMQSIVEMMLASIFGILNPSEELMQEYSCKHKITNNMPPTFLWTIAEDLIIDVDQSIDFIKTLARKGVPYEFHIFEKGAHGLSLADQTVGYSEVEITNNINANKWIDLALCWLKGTGF
ncbi:MAG: alpha/beta hydrolase [Firmicutes bacterium HGW-Firmicutes-7]|nr:MAG: alpha/beta hydrolase [Firmicutes bacterium HGW-Firmicutes-7]